MASARRSPTPVRSAIPEAYIVGHLQEAIDRAKERPHATFVTLDGDIVRGPLLIGGKTEGATPGVFSVKRPDRKDGKNPIPTKGGGRGIGVNVIWRRLSPMLVKPGRTLPKKPKCCVRYPALPPNCP